MGTTSNFSAPTPRKIHLGPFQPTLEAALATEISALKKSRGPLAPITIVVPTRLLGLHLQRSLARVLPNGHANLWFRTLTDLLPPIRLAPRLGLELLCDRIAQDNISATGYFAPVSGTRGFRGALLETFKDLEQSGTTPEAFRKSVAKSKKLSELSAAYTAYRDWLADHDFVTESDLFLKSVAADSTSEVLLYGFYDLTAAQKQFVKKLAPATIFFPWTDHNAFAEPLLDWFKSLKYKLAGPPPKIKHPKATILSCPGETSEVQEALRETLRFVSAEGRTFNDVAILCRSREQYDAVLRDTFANLGIPVYFRHGRPLTEQPDARLLCLLLETVRSEFSRASVMELACHLGPNSHWDALSVQLGIVGGQQQWIDRLEAVSAGPADERRGSDDARRREWRQRTAGQSLAFVKQLIALLGALPEETKWSEYAATLVTSFQALGGRDEAVISRLQALGELEAFQPRVSFDIFADYCQKSLDAAAHQPEKFEGGGVFVGDVMSARGLSWPLVIVLGLVEKSFPRPVREDPLLADAERARISADLQQKLDGHEEERLLFSLATAAAREKLVLSYPRLEPATSRPRLASFLLLEYADAASFEALEKQATKIPLSPVRETDEPLNERELDLAALESLVDKSHYLRQVSPLLADGVAHVGARWRERILTPYDGLFGSAESLKLLRERFGLEKIVISTTSLEDFFGCPFYYLQKRVLGIERWEEPEAALSIDALDLGSLYHAILEDYYQSQARDLAAVAEKHFREFERRGVTGYPTVWEIKKQIVVEELGAFIERDRAASAGWQPSKLEEEFHGIAVAPPVRLRGKIDRIDLSDDGRRARVLDYKTGRQPRSARDDSLAGGETLQLPLYILAAQQLLPKVTVESASYLFFTLRGGYRTISFTRTALDTQRAALTGMLDTAADMIRRGVFGQYATPDGCRNCEFRPICGNGILKLYELKEKDAHMEAFRAIKENVK
ncbi:MAG TPA: PD-(D/E)XK nuclease family protein [Verrucomicrobiae bacterium]|nr:PD-(D/E)XK nuclease family protein [Verrucomicrobiae bacterium]